MLSLWLSLSLVAGKTAWGAGECHDFVAPDYRSLCVCDPGQPATPSTPETPDTLNYTKTRDQFRSFLTTGGPALKKSMGMGGWGSFLQLTLFDSEPAKSAWVAQLNDLIPNYLDDPTAELPIPAPSPPMNIQGCVAKADALFTLAYEINQQVIRWLELVGPSVNTAKGVIRTQNVTPGADALPAFEPMGPKLSTLPRVIKLYGGASPSSQDANVALREYLAEVARIHTALRIGGSDQVARITKVKPANDPHFPGVINGRFVDLLNSKKGDSIEIELGYGWKPERYCGASTFSSGVCVLANDVEKVLAATDGTFPINHGCGTRTYSHPYCEKQSKTKKFHQTELRGAALTQMARIGRMVEDSIKTYGKIPSLKDFGLTGGVTEFPEKLRTEIAAERSVIHGEFDRFFKDAMSKASGEAAAISSLECSEFSNIENEMLDRKVDRMETKQLDKGKLAIKSSGAQACVLASLQSGDLNRTALYIRSLLDYLHGAIMEAYIKQLANQR